MVILAILSLVVLGQLLVTWDRSMGDQPTGLAEDGFERSAVSIQLAHPQEPRPVTKIARCGPVRLGK